MSRLTENPIAVILLGLGILLLSLYVGAVMIYGQEAAPTPISAADSDGDVQRELAEWWSWCLAHPKCVMRPSKNWRVIGRGESGRQAEEKLKVTGALPGRPPFASMIRVQGFRPFVRDGVLVGLWSDGWTYQTSSSTNIGVGPADNVIYEVPE